MEKKKKLEERERKWSKTGERMKIERMRIERMKEREKDREIKKGRKIEKLNRKKRQKDWNIEKERKKER